MKRLVLIALVSALAGPAAADTFELSDPANETSDPPPAEDSSTSGQDLPKNVLCTVDTANGACSCIDQVKARKIPLTQQECAERVRRSLDDRAP